MKELKQKLTVLRTYIELVKIMRNLNLINKSSENMLPAFGSNRCGNRTWGGDTPFWDEEVSSWNWHHRYHLGSLLGTCTILLLLFLPWCWTKERGFWFQVMRGWYHYLLTPGFNFPKGQKRAENTLVSPFIQIISVIFNECPLPPLSYSKQRAHTEQAISAQIQSTT